jgi:uncharacterized RDD family membrane protein YckC
MFASGPESLLSVTCTCRSIATGLSFRGVTSSEQFGVFYRHEDYVGVWRRLSIDVVDTLIALGVSLLTTVPLFLILPADRAAGIALASWSLIWFGYFVLLKRSRFRTLGYIIAGAQVVNLMGERPSILSLVGRLLFVVGGPANFLIDLLWISSDPSRQAIRDKFAHTYVIRKDAKPLGTGRIVYRTYVMMGTTFLFQEVAGAAQDSLSGA